MIEYLACGNVMSDETIEPGRAKSDRHMGGPAFFALAGMRLFTENVKLVSRVGRDFYDKDSYGDWMVKNGISDESVRVELENCSCFLLDYNSDGSGRNVVSVYGQEHLGYIKTSPEDIAAAMNGNVRGMYMAMGVDKVFWEKLHAIKQQYNFKIMWELEHFNCRNDVNLIRDVIGYADGFSLNYNEASKLFNIDREDDIAIIKELQKLPVGYTLYRVGKRGAFSVTPDGAWFCPSIDIYPYVDQTGCGNNSTGAAGYALTEGWSPEMIVAAANVSAGYNCAQFGPFPHFTDEIMKDGMEIIKKQAEKCVKVI